MARSTVRAVRVPGGGLADRFHPLDYSDAFAVAIPASADARSLAESIFTSPPWWVAGLVLLRNMLVLPLGLIATPSAFRREAVRANGIGDRIGMFPVVALAEDEVLLGLDDRHLDFRVSVRVFREGTAQRGVVTTLVRFHGKLGRTYFIPVLPLHRVIVPSMLRHGVTRLAAR